MKDMIGIVAGSINAGKPPEEIKADLVKEGLSDYDCFLTYQAAKLVARARKQEGPSRTSRR